MKKVIVTNIFGQSWKPEFEITEQANEWLAQHIANNTFGKPERWLPEFLLGAQERAIVTREATEAYEETRKIYDDNMNEIGTEVVLVPAQEAEYYLEYLHPAEYTYQIIEEDIAVVKARKIAELSAISLAKNEWISGVKSYQVVNIAMGKYIAEGKKAKEDQYKAEFIARSNVLTAELERCTALVDAATVEADINAITFSVE